MSSLVLAALSLLIYDTASAADSAPTPTSLELEIFRKGASATLNRLYRHDSEWNAVLTGIASGTVEWLQAVKKLYDVSDGNPPPPTDAAHDSRTESDSTTRLVFVPPAPGYVSLRMTKAPK